MKLNTFFSLLLNLRAVRSFFGGFYWWLYDFYDEGLLQLNGFLIAAIWLTYQCQNVNQGGEKKHNSVQLSSMANYCAGCLLLLHYKEHFNKCYFWHDTTAIHFSHKKALERVAVSGGIWSLWRTFIIHAACMKQTISLMTLLIPAITHLPFCCPAGATPHLQIEKQIFPQGHRSAESRPWQST